MEWRDEGVILSVRAHGESAAILDVFTEAHGRHAGVVRGGTSRRMKPILQPGSQVAVEWSARLEAHLGSYRVEPIRSRAAAVMADRLALEGLNAVCAMVAAAFPERAPETGFYYLTCELLDAVGDPAWARDYAMWEREMLTVLGFGLDLSQCAATGVDTDLIYVSPKSGRAVSRDGGRDWAHRLLPLPAFFLNEDVSTPGPEDIAAALRLTGHFLLQQALPALGRDHLPDARERLIRVVERRIQDNAKV